MTKRILNEEEVTTTVKKETPKKHKSAFVNVPPRWYRVAQMSGGSQGIYVVIVDSDESREKEIGERLNFMKWLSYRMAYTL